MPPARLPFVPPLALPLLAVAALATTGRAQVIQSLGSVTPQFSFGLFETSPIGPVTLTGGMPNGSLLWAPGAVFPHHISGSQGIAIALAQPSEARIGYAVDAAAAGGDHVVTLDFIALSNPMHWAGLPATGLAEVQGGLRIDLLGLPATAAGVLVHAEIALGNPGYYGNLHVDIGDDGSEEIAVESFNGTIASPIDAHGHLDLTPTMPRAIRVHGHLQALADNATSLATIHVEIRVAPGLAAQTATFGAGCGTTWSPTLTPVSMPQLGTMFLMEVDALPTTPTLTIGAIGFANGSYGGLPLPLDLAAAGMPGCNLWIAPEPVLFPAVGTGGTSLWGLAMPASLETIGLAFYAQAFAVAPGANAAGLLASNACSAVVGL